MNYLPYLSWAVLVVNSVIAMGDGTPDVSSGIFEVDLIFPRNETYTPQALMPIVFALQNPSLASPLAATITWGLREGNNWSAPGSITGGAFELSTLNLPTTGPGFATSIFNTLSYPDGSWTFAWNLQLYNCSVADSASCLLSESVNCSLAYNPDQIIEIYNTVVFTVSQSGQAPSLEAATSSDMCGTMEAYAFNVTSTRAACGFLAPSPTTNPCAATINNSAASSIWATATDFACDPRTHSEYPNVTCPTPSSKSNGARQYGMVAALTLLTLFTMATALIHLG
ncbi:hypothetical protein CBS63078_6422 [Aspergillus niger]|nr:hypothetical protein CBS115989_9429 [Aspergillus niger]KAI2829201.1 hypothetical protein CBS133816_4738 [Aspergillus niger]KAI2837833.1 hypothetical protein CBS11350_8498 [Aspergillus niger]KAI2840646.1 hypothetical protein CBS11232_9027 [Aspergillus niger]KAI2852082.1 hypothetical protein CBS12448_8328 [Aspergillus niger]|eukprot:XP_001395676.2 hypothetical protein ANI_1_1956104 [Aspergillus niger CBS 513.88]